METISHYITGYCRELPEKSETVNVSAIFGTSFLSGQLHPDKQSPFYPGRSDEKIMRNDVIASIISIRKMLAEQNITSASGLEKMSLFVANGAFMENPEKHLRKIPEVYGSFTPETSEVEKGRKIYAASPPLLALETLTNSTMSFIAQYTGIKGQNATFGNTSIGSFYALSTALGLVNEDGRQALVCGCNCGGIYSFMSNSGVAGKTSGLSEGAATASVIIQGAKQVPENALCKITVLNSSKIVPSLEKTGTLRSWKKLLPPSPGDLLIFSGAFVDEEYESDEIYCSSIAGNIFSFFKSYGNMGPANLVLGLIRGIESLGESINIVDIVDRDVYGRESLIRIEKC